MKITLEISDDKIQFLSEGAVEHLQVLATRYVENTVDEATRIYHLRRPDNDNHAPEITVAHVDDADQIDKLLGSRPKKTRKSLLLQTIAFGSSFIAGGLFQFDRMENPVHLACFLVFFAAAFISNFYLFIKERSNED